MGLYIFYDTIYCNESISHNDIRVFMQPKEDIKKDKQFDGNVS